MKTLRRLAGAFAVVSIVLSVGGASTFAAENGDFSFKRTSCDFSMKIHSSEEAKRIFSALSPSTETTGDSSVKRSLVINNYIDQLEITCNSASETTCSLRYAHHLWRTKYCTPAAAPEFLKVLFAAETSADLGAALRPFQSYLMSTDGHHYRLTYNCQRVRSPVTSTRALSCELAFERQE